MHTAENAVSNINCSFYIPILPGSISVLKFIYNVYILLSILQILFHYAVHSINMLCVLACIFTVSSRSGSWTRSVSIQWFYSPNVGNSYIIKLYLERAVNKSELVRAVEFLMLFLGLTPSPAIITSAQHSLVGIQFPAMLAFTLLSNSAGRLKWMFASYSRNHNTLPYWGQCQIITIHSSVFLFLWF
jgi:hypothetical protein